MKKAELEHALDHVKTLQGVLPICSHCHKIRNDQQMWDRLEAYLSKHTDATLSHGICPECAGNITLAWTFTVIDNDEDGKAQVPCSSPTAFKASNMRIR